MRRNTFLKLVPLFALALVLSALVGCAFLDNFFGVNRPDGATDPNYVSPAQQIGNFVSVLIPGWGTIVSGALAGATWLYTSIRGKKREQAIPALVLDIMKAVMAAKGGKVDYDALYTSLQGASNLVANKDKFIKLVVDIEASVKKELADGFQAEDLAKIANAVKDDLNDLKSIVGPVAPVVPVAPPAPEAPVAPSTDAPGPDA